ncbi:ribonuclease H-like domain-containing protein [Tanacetum coccineum]
MRLDECYHPVRSALLTRDPLPDVKDAYNTVSREESHRGIPESSGVFETKINSTSFVVKSFNNNKRNFNNNNNTRGFTSNVSNNRGPNPNLNCKNYGKIRHTVDKCYEIIRFPPMKKLLSLISDIGSGNFHANMAVLGTGSESGGLYLFDTSPKGSLGESNMVLSFHVSKLLWHNRLGHPVDQVLATLHNDLKIFKTGYVPVCESRRRKRREDPVNLVTLTGGPYKVTRKEGYKYFLTIADDFSRAVWVYLIKSKDEVFDVFVSFINLIHNQFQIKIKIVRPQSPNDERRTSSVEDGSRPLHRHRFTDTTNLYQKEHNMFCWNLGMTDLVSAKIVDKDQKEKGFVNTEVLDKFDSKA